MHELQGLWIAQEIVKLLLPCQSFGNPWWVRTRERGFAIWDDVRSPIRFPPFTAAAVMNLLAKAL